MKKFAAALTLALLAGGGLAYGQFGPGPIPGGTGCTVGGSSGDLQKNNGGGGCSSSALNDNGTIVKSTENVVLGVGATAIAHEAANEAGTGTTTSKLAKLTGAPSTAIITGTGDTDGIIGICIGNCTTTGNAQIAYSGVATCVFDGATTAGHYVQNSATTAGDCHDAGATRPASGQVVGQVTTTNGGAGTYQITLQIAPPGASATGAGVQAGQSPSNIGDNATALPSGHYYYATNANMTAQRTHNLPDSATQGVGDLEIFDEKQTVTSTNQLCAQAAGTDKINTVTNGTACITTQGGSIYFHNDGAGNYTTGAAANIPAPTNGQIIVGKTGSPANSLAAVTMSGDCTITNAGAETCNTVLGGHTPMTNDQTGQAYTGGIHPTAFSNGTASSGTKTIDCGSGPIQSLTNGGAFTLAMSANDGSCVVRVTNNGSAGTITFSGFTEGTNKGDALTTTNTNIFDITLTRIGGNPHYLVSALQ